ncbi:hypothetical protein EON66_02125 [archaeon]|nr:MAG: hypothetical protein EON66_02125 [archaeon]
MPDASHTPVHALVRRQLVLDHPADACVDVPSPPPRLDEAIQTESQVQGARVDASVVTDITASEITRELAAAFISGRTNTPTTPRTSINATTPNDAAAHVHSEPARDDPIRAVCSSTGVLMNELIVEADTPPRTPPTRASVTVTAEDEANAAPVSTPLSFLLSPGSSSESPVRRAPHTPKRANAPSDAYASPVNVRSTSTRECVPRISSVLATGTPPRHPSSSSSDRGAASPHNSEAQQHWQPHAMAGTHVEESGGRHAAFPAVPLFTTSASISTPTQPRDACVDALRASHASSTQSFLWDISTEAGEDDDRGFSAAELEEHVPKHDNLPGHRTTCVRTSTVAQQPDEGVHNELAPEVGTPTPQGQSVSGSEVSLFQPSTHWPLAEADSLVNMRGYVLPDTHATRPPVATTYFTRADALHGADAATRVPSSTPLPLAAPTGVLPAAAVGTVFVYAPALGAYVPVSYAPAYALDDVTAATPQTMAVPPPPAVMKASASPPVTHPVIASRDMRATRGGARLGQPAPQTAAAAAVGAGDGDAEHRAAGGSEPHLRTDSFLQHHTASLQASTASLASSNSRRSRATRTPAAKPPKLSLASILAPLPHVRLPLSFEGE